MTLTPKQIAKLVELGFMQYGPGEYNKRYGKIGRIWITAREYADKVYVSPFWCESNKQAQLDLSELRKEGIE